jgi:type IV pilus assembly protein PilX
VALLLLLVMTILGVTALSSSTMQGFMSASYQQQTSTLAGVENVLLEGEFDVLDLVNNGVGIRPHFFNLMEESPPAQFPAGSANADWTTLGKAVSRTVGPFQIPGHFVVEYLAEIDVPGESIAEGGGLEDSTVHVFRVSARGTEQQRGGLRVVQSLYVTLRGPE